MGVHHANGRDRPGDLGRWLHAREDDVLSDQAISSPMPEDADQSDKLTAMAEAAHDALAPPLPAPKRCCILILGMHRSGTSALTRVVSLLGAGLPTHLLGADPDNETGHWEPAQLLAVNDSILAAHGSRWNDFRPLPALSPSDEPLAALLRDAATTIRAEYGENPLIVLKEPRICRMMHYYRGVLAECGYQIVIILSLRHPLSVIASVHRRNALPRPVAGLLWLRHVLDAERETRGSPRVILSYDRLLGDWRTAMQSTSEALTIDWPRSVEEAAADIEDFLDPALRHHVNEGGALELAPNIGPWIEDAYGAMLALEKDASDVEAFAALDRVTASFERHLDATLAIVDPISAGIGTWD